MIITTWYSCMAGASRCQSDSNAWKEHHKGRLTALEHHELYTNWSSIYFLHELQFVWVAPIIITYSNTTPVFSNCIFRFFLSVFFNDNFIALFTSCLKIFHLQIAQKKWRDTKVQSPICHSRKVAAETRESFINVCSNRGYISWNELRN